MATCAELGWEVLARRLCCWTQWQLMLCLLLSTVPGAGRTICTSHLDLQLHILGLLEALTLISVTPLWELHPPPKEVTTTLGLGAQVLLPRNTLSQVVQSLDIG